MIKQQSKFKVVVLEDEPMANEMMVDFINQIEGCHVTASFTHPALFIEHAQNHHFDLLILDMQLGKMNGFEVIKFINQPIHIIVTTGFSQYASESYEVKNHIVVDYVLKPVLFERLQEAIWKFEKRYAEYSAFLKSENNKDVLMLKTSENEIITVRISTIVNISAEVTNYCKVLYSTSKELITRCSLDALMESLPDYFVRVSKSQIINLKKITIDMEEKTFTYKEKTESISPRYWEVNKSFIKKFFNRQRKYKH